MALGGRIERLERRVGAGGNWDAAALRAECRRVAAESGLDEAELFDVATEVMQFAETSALSIDSPAFAAAWRAAKGEVFA